LFTDLVAAIPGYRILAQVVIVAVFKPLRLHKMFIPTLSILKHLRDALAKCLVGPTEDRERFKLEEDDVFYPIMGQILSFINFVRIPIHLPIPRWLKRVFTVEKLITFRSLKVVKPYRLIPDGYHQPNNRCQFVSSFLDIKINLKAKLVFSEFGLFVFVA